MDDLTRQMKLDELYRTMNLLCWECHHACDWSKMDKLLDQINIQETENDILIGYLTTSAWGKQHLTRREKFYERVRNKLIDDDEDYSNDFDRENIFTWLVKKVSARRAKAMEVDRLLDGLE